MTGISRRALLQFSAGAAILGATGPVLAGAPQQPSLVLRDTSFKLPPSILDSLLVRGDRVVDFNRDAVYAWYEKLQPALHQNPVPVLGITDQHTATTLEVLAREFGLARGEAVQCNLGNDNGSAALIWLLNPAITCAL